MSTTISTSAQLNAILALSAVVPCKCNRVPLDRPHWLLHTRLLHSIPSAHLRFHVSALTDPCPPPISTAVMTLKSTSKSASTSSTSSTKPKNKYSVILPTYNERQNLPLIIALLTHTFTTHSLVYEIIVVDDNSPDGTAVIAEQLRGIYGDEHVKLLKRAGKLGLGSAYRDGLKHVTGNWVILMDADFSHHPNFIPAFIESERTRDTLHCCSVARLLAVQSILPSALTVTACGSCGAVCVS